MSAGRNPEERLKPLPTTCRMKPLPTTRVNPEERLKPLPTTHPSTMQSGRGFSLYSGLER